MSVELPPGTGLAPHISDEDVVSLARAAIETSRAKSRRLDDGSTSLEIQQHGITVDLTHKNIIKLPDGVVDIIKDEIERQVLALFSISSFRIELLTSILPVQTCYLAQPYCLIALKACGMQKTEILECSLEQLEGGPEAYASRRPSKHMTHQVLQLVSLEILDLSRNRIKILPEAIGALTSLKVLAISRNKIERLPLCLGDLGRLQLLKFDENPLVFPPPEAYAPDSDIIRRGDANEEEAITTAKMKRFLKSQVSKVAVQERTRSDSNVVDTNYDNAETPRPQGRNRGATGRFATRPSNGILDAPSSLMTSPERQSSLQPVPDTLPPISFRYEDMVPQVPPRSEQRSEQRPEQRPEPRSEHRFEHRSGQSKSGQESNIQNMQRQGGFLSPPEGRAPANPLGTGQSSGSGDSFSKNYRSTTIITPRLTKNPASSDPFSAMSPAIFQPPKTSLLVGREGNILGHFEQADYANAEAARKKEIARQVADRVGHEGFVRTSRGSKQLLLAAFSYQSAMLEQKSRLALIRAAFPEPSEASRDLDFLIEAIRSDAVVLQAHLKAYDHRPLNERPLTLGEMKEIELAICKYCATAAMFADFYQQYCQRINLLGDSNTRLNLFSMTYSAVELAHASRHLEIAYNVLSMPIGVPHPLQTSNSIAPPTQVKPQARRPTVNKSAGGLHSGDTTAVIRSQQSGVTSSFRFPSSPPPQLSIIATSVANEKFPMSPTEVPDMFSNRDFVTAGPHAKDDLHFAQICKELQKTIQICNDSKDSSVTPGLAVIREHYKSMIYLFSTDPNHGPKSDKVHGFQDLEQRVHECYFKIDKLGSLIARGESRARNVDSPEFWMLVRDAITLWQKHVKELKDLRVNTDPDTKGVMKGIHKSIKSVSAMIRSSPWGNYMAGEDVILSQLPPHVKQSSIGSVPTTPMGAALGPAAAAAIPNAAHKKFNVFERADQLLATNQGPFRRAR